MGAKIVAVADHTGFIRDDNGIDCFALTKHAESTGGVRGYQAATEVTEEEYYSTKVDVFVPGALEQMITPERAQWLDCKVMVEAANAPSTPGGDRILVSKGVEIIPAILANAGGVTVSYFEWLQNKSSVVWSAEQVDRELNRHMVLAARRTLGFRDEHKCDLRTAAFAAALDHIGDVYKVRGIFP